MLIKRLHKGKTGIYQPWAEFEVFSDLFWLMFCLKSRNNSLKVCNSIPKLPCLAQFAGYLVKSSNIEAKKKSRLILLFFASFCLFFFLNYLIE